MNNLPLQPLVWKDYGKGTASETRSALHEYDAWQTDNDRGWIVGYFDRRNPTGIKEATGFATIDEAKAWAWKHYSEKMQPYVKPMPTWVDVNERLPERKELLTDKDKCLVLTECGKVWTGFYNIHIKPDDWYLHGWTEKQGWHPFKIVAWMLASEFSTMQNLHKGGDCE